MKFKNKTAVSLFLIVSLLLSISLPAYAAQTKNTSPLKFNQDGSFTILQITDTQDTQWTSPNCLTLIQKALDESKPNLVVFTGDQLKNYDSDFEGPGVKWKVEKTLDLIVRPVVSRGIPFAVAFGNHDSCLSVTLEEQVKMLQKYKGCLLVDEGSAISGCGNYNLPILSSDGTRTAFNIFLLDSNQAEVLPDQIDWYISKSDELKAANGGVPVPSIEFQHIVAYNENLLGAFESQGDVIASFCGHDHYRSDTVISHGIDLVYTPTAGFDAFGPGKDAGVRVIELHENNTAKYDTHILTFVGLLGDNPVTDLRFKLFTLGALDGDFFSVATGLMNDIVKAISYISDESQGDIGKFAVALCEFFGADVHL